MTAVEIIKIALTSTQNMLNWYLSDLSDDDLKTRPVPGANTVGWQLGHLIGSEKILLEGQLPGVGFPDLPDTIKDQYSNKTATTEPPAGYLSKAAYLEWFNKIRAATIAAVDKIKDADLDKPNTNQMAQIAPTLGALLILASNHTLMHAGQFSVTRRALNKPVLF